MKTKKIIIFILSALRWIALIFFVWIAINIFFVYFDNWVTENFLRGPYLAIGDNSVTGVIVYNDDPTLPIIVGTISALLAVSLFFLKRIYYLFLPEK